MINFNEIEEKIYTKLFNKTQPFCQHGIELMFNELSIKKDAKILVANFLIKCIMNKLIKTENEKTCNYSNVEHKFYSLNRENKYFGGEKRMTITHGEFKKLSARKIEMFNEIISAGKDCFCIHELAKLISNISPHLSEPKKLEYASGLIQHSLRQKIVSAINHASCDASKKIHTIYAIKIDKMNSIEKKQKVCNKAPTIIMDKLLKNENHKVNIVFEGKMTITINE